VTEFAVDLRRTIAAPRDAVFRAFLDPATLQRWMSPEDSVVTLATVDERVGGRHRVEMLTPAGERHAFDSVIRELVPGERIVLDFAFEGTRAALREETVLTLTFRDAGDGATELRLVQERITLAPPFDEQSVHAGWTSALGKLEALYERSERT
jgi:uncharacterized protein YndB with AHSA1/START domain